MEIGLPAASAALGALLVIAAALSGVVHRTILSLTVVAVIAGAVLTGAGILVVEPGAESIIVTVEVVLLLTLFADGLLVEYDLVRRHWTAAARALVVAMPINAALLAVAAKLLFADLTWAETFLLGFVLSPTDPVVTSALVASERVPRRVRQVLNLESGLNDGLALPFVLFFLALSEPDGAEIIGTGSSLLGETAVGLLVGGGVGLAAGRLVGFLPDRTVTHTYEGLIMLGTAGLSFGGAELVHGNGLIAAFTGGAAFGVLRAEAADLFHRRNENILNVVQLVAFVLFGALVAEVGFSRHAPAVVAFVVIALVVARPLSVLVAFAGLDLHRPERLFIAWFGPKGIASMLFALFILDSAAPDRPLLFEIAAVTILASIVAHGLTDTLGSSRIAAAMERREERGDDVDEDAQPAQTR